MKLIILLTAFAISANCASKYSSPEDLKQFSTADSLVESTFPKEQWVIIDPELVGFSSSGLENAKMKFEETGGVSMLVVHKGYIIADWGANEENIDSRSIRKSLFNSVIGIYEDQGLLNIQNTLADLEMNDMNRLTEFERQATVKHLMTSSSGIYLSAAFEEEVHRDKPERESDSPGSKFLYNNWDFNILSGIFNKATNEDLFVAFDEKIAQPLQFEYFDANYHTGYFYQKNLSDFPAYFFLISSKDLARFGLLYLHEGNWDGTQIIPKEWVIESTSTQIETGEDFYYDYGYLWWVTKASNEGVRNPFLARGAQSQYMYIDPSNELIIVFRDNPSSTIPVKKSEAYPLIADIYKSMMR